MSLNLLDMDAFILDMDGTVYLGEDLIEGADLFIKRLREHGKPLLFLTNNSSKNNQAYKKKLQNLGIEVADEEILTSGEIAIQYLLEKNIQKVYPIGTPSFEDLIENSNLEISQQSPEMVILAFDTTLTYEKLKIACSHIQKGIPWMTTHPDLVCPTKNGFIPDCGAIQALIETATEISPEVVLGKPHPYVGKVALARLNTTESKVAIIGDRIYTDIALGKITGINTILVLSGETKENESAMMEDLIPDLVCSSLKELAEKL